LVARAAGRVANRTGQASSVPAVLRSSVAPADGRWTQRG